MKNYVYSFGGGTADGDGKMKEVLGGKGAGLAEMSRAGVPVPPGFTISTEVCNIYFENKNSVPEEINRQVLKALAKPCGVAYFAGHKGKLAQADPFYLGLLKEGSVALTVDRPDLVLPMVP